MTTDQLEHFEERAAIYEFDAGMTRQEAERRAAEDARRCLPSGAQRAPLSDERGAAAHHAGEGR
jgi:hypothetical protein